MYHRTNTDDLFNGPLFYVNCTSLQDGGGNPGDPEEEGGPAERKRGAAEKAGAEHRSEERETRGEQVILLFIVTAGPIFHFSYYLVKVQDLNLSIVTGKRAWRV